jgi:hypothetical protein
MWKNLIANFPRHKTGNMENDAPSNSSVISCAFVPAVTILWCRCLPAIRGCTYKYRLIEWIYEVEFEVQIQARRLTYLRVGLPSEAHDQIFVFCLTIAGSLMWYALCGERMGLQITRAIASGSCQSSYFRVQVPQNSGPYFNFSYESPST